ncbi:hypothetical protein [Nonomuraea sp. B1E8]|uniref:class I SAM-dependent methyltransferase n=1 Tax=unclassified Nonomuraea TaxID=2593643 RepID=UPI00325D3408
MPDAPQELHLDHERAGSFGAAAEQYDRYRLTYPRELIDDLAGPQPTTVLDVGCGTGKAAEVLNVGGTIARSWTSTAVSFSAVNSERPGFHARSR